MSENAPKTTEELIAYIWQIGENLRAGKISDADALRSLREAEAKIAAARNELRELARRKPPVP